MKWYKQEIRKLKKLPCKEQVQYIWDYYKLWIIGVVAVLFIAGYLLTNYIQNNRAQHLYVSFVNTYANFDTDSEFYQDYVAYSGVNIKEETISFDTLNYFDLTKGDVTGNYYYEKMAVLLDAGTIDAVIMEPDEFCVMAERGRLIDLSHDKIKHLLEQYQERIVTISHIDEDGSKSEIPVGIDLRGSRIVTKEQAYADDCVLGISAYSKNIDAVELFLSYVLEGV